MGQVDKIRKQHKEEINKKIAKLDKEHQKICRRIYNSYCTEYWCGRRDDNLESDIIEKFKSNIYKIPSDIFGEENKVILDLFVEEKLQNKFLYIINKLNKFQLGEGYYRRSMRINNYGPKVGTVFRIMCNFSKFSFIGYSLTDIIKNEVSDEVIEFIKEHVGIDDLIAATLDLNDEDLKNTLEEVILSESNTHIITLDIIKGIVKSDNKKMHKILGDFLLAARLQEGVRQAICENMDCGVSEAFIYLLEVIDENNLIRFSSVKRAVCTWIGLYDEENVNRVVPKIFSLMLKSLKDENLTKELLESKDAIEFMVGLWTMGFYDLKDVFKFANELMEDGDEEKLIGISHYLRMVELGEYNYEFSKKIVEKYSHNLKLIASYLEFYKDEISSAYYFFTKCEKGIIKDSSDEERKTYLNKLFKNEEEARSHYDILYKIFKNMKKSKEVYGKESFPYEKIELSKSTLAYIICNIGYILNDENLINECCSIIKNIDSWQRSEFINLLLKNPQNKKQRDTLISLVGDRDPDTFNQAFKTLKKLDLNKDDFGKLEKLYTRKTGEIRANVTALMMKANDDYLNICLHRLLNSSKEDVRMGGLDILVSLSKNTNRFKFYDEIKDKLLKLESPSDREEVIINSLLNIKKDKPDNKYNLYDPKINMSMTKLEDKVKKMESEAEDRDIKDIFTMEKEEALLIIKKLSLIIEKNKTKSYKNLYGCEEILGNDIDYMDYDDDKVPVERLPYSDLWVDFYNENIGNFEKLMNLKLYATREIKRLGLYKKSTHIIENLLGKNPYMDISEIKYRRSIVFIIDVLYETYLDKKLLFEMSKKALTNLNEKVNSQFISLEKMKVLVKGLDCFESDKEYLDSFLLRYKIDKLYKFKTLCDEYEIKSLTNIFDYIKLHEMGLIKEEDIYKALFEELPFKQNLNLLSKIVDFLYDSSNKRYLDDEYEIYIKYFKEERFDLIYPLYTKITDAILNVELKRGESPTEFSKIINNIKVIFSSEKFVQILKALGNDKLVRDYYYYSEITSRKEVLSYLLKICKPLKTDNKEILGQYLENTNISKERLIEAAMYNPDWIDIISDYLQLKDLKKGVYYFYAHMNDEYIDEKIVAIIKKYTPLEIEELRSGAFDITWFRECYESLGEENFQILYEAAKYITDGAKYTRARHFSDAVTGKLKKAEIKSKVIDKRNKDLLLAYALIPLENEEDLLNRYEYINVFLKESKQFGAQRRASEKTTCEMAIRNLAINSGFNDSMRLILKMENKLIKDMNEYFEEKIIDDISVKIVIDENGKSDIECVKNDKKLKAIPVKYKKNNYIITLKEKEKSLKEQYRRTRKMMEDAMENKEEFYFEEIKNLINNPVVNPIFSNLVFIKDDKVLGFICEDGLENFEGKVFKLDDKENIRVAHVYDLYKNEVLHKYQKYIFENKIKQPFKQVFRELYVKTADELNKDTSLRYAGNQIQTRKTVSTLKTRDWICDYEDGLQKVYYKENIVSSIYAVADWFSPSDIEAPTIEGVTFYNRKTFEPIKIDEVPDIIFSEVMRDTDLAVSVAHVGGVDPQTSMSTMEMRREIFKFNLELFKLDNVIFEDRFATVKGDRAEYSIHLGSGVVHQIGGSAINVVAVHSSHRGKIFLPFIDEDPKSAEIMSKIVLFAQDKKIKDPYILNQIKNIDN